MPQFRRRVVLTVSSVVFLALSIAACGGSASQSHSTTTATTAAQKQGGTPTVSGGPVHGTLKAAGHAPTVNKPWAYSVRVTDAAGHLLTGTVEIQFVYGDQVVGRDTPPTHPITAGRWKDRLTFPAAAIGMPLTFRAVVRTPVGSITLDWPVKVRA